MRQVVRVDVAAPRDLVVASAAALPGMVAAGPGRFEIDLPGVPGGRATVEAVVAGSGTSLSVDGTADLAVPFFRRVLRPLISRALRRECRHLAGAVDARSRDLPAPARRSLAVLPAVAFTPAQATMLSVAAAATAVVTFGSALFGQNASYVADRFGADDSALGNALAAARVGVLLSLVAAALADRLGRRRVIIVGTVGSCAAAALSAAAPSLAAFTAAQVLGRGFVITTTAVAAIAAVEEAPEGARAFAASMLALAGGFGFSLAVITLPLADLGPDGWRISYVAAGMGVLLIPRIARHLTETHRYRTLAASGIRRGRLTAVVAAGYRRRFLLLAAVGFLTNVFNAPSAQFMNKYLDDTHDFSAAGIGGFRALTGALPGIVGLLLAARLAESRGRRPVAAVGVFFGVATQMLFFLGSGPTLWLAATLSTAAASCGWIALGTLGAELFPTEVRGTANGLLLVVSVAGSITGLLVAGHLADPLGGLGPAVAWCGAGALAAAVLLVPLLPEPQARRLDDLSPSAGPTWSGPQTF